MTVISEPFRPMTRGGPTEEPPAPRGAAAGDTRRRLPGSAPRSSDTPAVPRPPAPGPRGLAGCFSGGRLSRDTPSPRVFPFGRGGLITHRFALDDIVEAYDLFSNRREGVLKVAVHP